MERKIIYFINPISGTKGKDELLGLIRAETAARKIPFEILNTNAEGNYKYLEQKISSENVTDIVICGGDGTVNQVANSLLGINVRIGIIPMGSGNGLAFAAKIPKDPLKALQLIFEANATAIDSFYINKKFSCMLCGLGFDAQVAHDFARQKKKRLANLYQANIKEFLFGQALSFFN